MKAKEYLKNIEKIDRLIEEKLLQKEEYSEMKIFNLKLGGFKNATKCKKCYGKGFISK